VKRIDPDELQWRLADVVADDAEAMPSDDALDAYRKRTLGAEERREVEAALLGNPGARARLIAGAAPDLATPPPHLRELVLAHAPSRRRIWPLIFAAAGVAATLAVVIAGSLLFSPHVPGDVGYQVVTSGLADVRGESAPRPGGTTLAFPSTTVRIEARPTSGATAAVEVGLYREREGGIDRIDGYAGVVASRRHGAVSFSARAVDLVGSTPGTRSVLVVVAKRGDLPAVFALEQGEDAETLLLGKDRRRVFRQEITIVPETP
jgi:hypothetical protein